MNSLFWRGKHHTLDDCAPQNVQGVSECRAIFHSNRNDSAAARDTLFWAEKSVSLQNFAGNAGFSVRDTHFCGENPVSLQITQSMSRKGNCMDNGAMENFFGRLKVEMFYGEQFESVDDFIQALDDYIYYYNNDRISLKLKGMSPVQYRTHSQAS